MEDKLRRAYWHYRSQSRGGNQSSIATPAHIALTCAREACAINPIQPYSRNPYGYGPKFGHPTGQGSRWIDNVHGAFRVVGFSDEITRFKGGHTGWFARSDDPCEVYRGMVLRLTSKRGKARFVAAHSDPNDDDAATCEMEIYHANEGDAKDAAIMADRFAESEAEYARGYNDLCDVGCNYRRAHEAMSSLFEDFQKLNASRKQSAPLDSTIANTVRRELIRTWQNYREEQEAALEALSDCPRGETKRHAILRSAWLDGADLLEVPLV